MIVSGSMFPIMWLNSTVAGETSMLTEPPEDEFNWAELMVMVNDMTQSEGESPRPRWTEAVCAWGVITDED